MQAEQKQESKTVRKKRRATGQPAKEKEKRI
nr:MAG TPA: hypothetical protein [Caudoviricetes sp.]